MKAGIYARNATGDPSKLGDQEALCRAYASAQGWAIVAVWANAGSGASDDRPRLRALLEAVLDGEIGALVMTRPNRFGRNSEAMRSLLVDFKHAEVAVEFTEEPYLWQFREAMLEPVTNREVQR